VQKALGERVKELNKPKDGDEKKPEASPSKDGGTGYADAHETHSCTDH
jgi:hypothetical protein